MYSYIFSFLSCTIEFHFTFPVTQFTVYLVFLYKLTIMSLSGVFLHSFDKFFHAQLSFSLIFFSILFVMHLGYPIGVQSVIYAVHNGGGVVFSTMHIHFSVLWVIWFSH